MEALPIIMAVYTLAAGVNAWIGLRAEKGRTVKEISATISRIEHILLPLKTIQNVDKPVLDSVRSIGDALKRTQEHLLVWEYKRMNRVASLLIPSTALGQLRGDARHLDQQLLLLLTTLAVVQYSHSQSGISGSSAGSEPGSSVAGGTGSSATVLDWVENRDVKEFWGGYIGEKIPFISELEFCSRLSSWLGETVSSTSFGQLMLRLDEFGIGGVTPSHLEEIAAGNSLRDVLKMYMETDWPLAFPSALSESRLAENPTTEIKLPLLVWIDDNPINNTYEVSYARELGINVIQLTSTALAKVWIKENSDFLRQNDDPSMIRFISDNHRDEYGSDTMYLNFSAGENILRFLRGHHYNAPVLIFTGWSVRITHYVADYQLAGSTKYSNVCCRYISSLGVGGTDDLGWMTFMAGSTMEGQVLSDD